MMAMTTMSCVRGRSAFAMHAEPRRAASAPAVVGREQRPSLRNADPTDDAMSSEYQSDACGSEKRGMRENVNSAAALDDMAAEPAQGAASPAGRGSNWSDESDEEEQQLPSPAEAAPTTSSESLASGIPASSYMPVYGAGRQATRSSSSLSSVGHQSSTGQPPLRPPMHSYPHLEPPRPPQQHHIPAPVVTHATPVPTPKKAAAAKPVTGKIISMGAALPPPSVYPAAYPPMAMYPPRYPGVPYPVAMMPGYPVHPMHAGYPYPTPVYDGRVHKKRRRGHRGRGGRGRKTADGEGEADAASGDEAMPMSEE